MTRHYQIVLLCYQKFRDSQGLKIASYFLKTLFLWEIDKNEDPDLWKMKQGPLFIHVRIILFHLNICNFLCPCSVCCQSYLFEIYLLTPWCIVLLEQLTGAASQEIPRISRNPKVHYRTYKRQPPVSILGQPNPVHIPTSHLLEIHPNIIHPSTPRSPSRLFPSSFPSKTLYTPLSSSIRATCPAHLILLDFITRTIFLFETHL